MTNNQTIIDVALELLDSCWNTYASTMLVFHFLKKCKLNRISRTGIGPETFAFASSDGGYTNGVAPTTDQQGFYKKHGFYITDSHYILRPEVIESNFYAWRSTGDVKYLDRASQVIQNINKYLSVNNTYAGIEDVSSANSNKINDMESFWFAETLKYLYVT